MSDVLLTAMKDLVWYGSIFAIGYAVVWVCLAVALGIVCQWRDR